MRVYIQKDKANDQVYIGLEPDAAAVQGRAKKTVRATDDVVLDLGGRGRLVGIDISNASRVLGRRVFEEGIAGDELVGVAEAAKLCGVRKPNFIRDFASRPDFPRPVADLASGRIWRRSDISDFLDRIRGIIEFALAQKVEPTDFVRKDNLVRRHVQRATDRARSQRSKSLASARRAASRPAMRPKTAPRRTDVAPG